MAKEYNFNLIKRSATGFVISLPIIFIALVQNYWIFFTTITAICSFAMYEWIKNNFRYPILWGFSLIFLYFWFSIIYLIGAVCNIFPSHDLIESYIGATSIKNIFNSAYLFGSNFGKTSIAPSISPNKTLEGLIGGLVVVFIYALTVCYFFILKYSFIPIFILGGFLAFFGDLLISFHKRDRGIKDTGSLLPGHGGVLDRIDSHLLATPILLFISIVIESL